MSVFDKVTEKMDNGLLQKLISTGMMNEILSLSQGPKGGNAQFQQDSERIASYFGEFKHGYFTYIGPGSEETWKCEKSTQTTRKVNGIRLQDNSRKFFANKNIQSWEDA